MDATSSDSISTITDSTPDNTSSIPHFSVSDFLAATNQTLDYAFSNVEVEGEVANYKVSKGRWVFFDLKDQESTVPVFLTIFQLHTTIRDGMKVIVSGTPKLTKVGRFSLTANRVQPIGEGNIKKSFELLKAKLTRQGVFDPTKKRPIPADLHTIGVISSVTAAGYADFIKILGERWGGLDIWVANCGVQGLYAADEIIRALDFFNFERNVDIIVIIRGGGSADDLALFNDELLAKKISSSRIPVLTGIGHETDESLADLAADVRASTPTNAAELLTKDKAAELWRLYDNLSALSHFLGNHLAVQQNSIATNIKNLTSKLLFNLDSASQKIQNQKNLLASFNPESVLKTGYAIVSGKISPGNIVKITTSTQLITAKVQNVTKRTTKN